MCNCGSITLCLVYATTAHDNVLILCNGFKLSTRALYVYNMELNQHSNENPVLILCELKKINIHFSKFDCSEISRHGNFSKSTINLPLSHRRRTKRMENRYKQSFYMIKIWTIKENSDTFSLLFHVRCRGGCLMTTALILAFSSYSIATIILHSTVI